MCIGQVPTTQVRRCYSKAQRSTSSGQGRQGQGAVAGADVLHDKVVRPPANARTYPFPTFPGGGALYHMQCQECGLIYADLGEKDPACICGVVGKFNFTWLGGPLPFVCEGSLAQDRANSLAIP